MFSHCPHSRATHACAHCPVHEHILTHTSACTLSHRHMHTHIRAWAHSHSAQSHAYTQMCVQSHTHSRVCTHARSHMTHAHSHLCTHTHTHFHRVASPANSQGSQMTGDSHSSSSMFLTPPGKKEKGLLPAPHFPLYLPVFSVQNRSSNHQGVVLSREGNE